VKTMLQERFLTLADGRQLSALLAACPFTGLQRLTPDDTNNSLV